MITKFFVHFYILAAIAIAALFVYDDIAYKHVMFEIARAQASALIVLAQHIIGA